MAQTGFTPIQLYSSSTATNVPLAANLATGELAINITDGKLFYKDNANAVQVIGWKVVPATAGGTGQTSYAVGDLLYADTTTTLAKLPDVATGNALISGGVSTAPSWGKIGLTTHVSGVLPVANGGTGLSSLGPAFSVYANTNQSTTASSFTKIILDTEVFDTNNNFDPTTNYRFTPTVAGYYQISCAVTFTTTTAITAGVAAVIYKNGTAYAWGSAVATATMYPTATTSSLIYFNGSSDYVELYVYNGTGVTTSTNGNSTYTFMTGFLARSA